MNAILQAFVHNPPMRNYFLSDMHNRSNCPRAGEEVCLGCEMDYLFAQVFSGLRTPYTPQHFLYSVWKYADYFAGYEQQDAHEFLISALNAIHTHCQGLTQNCTCIIHRIFSGYMRSDLTCLRCGLISTAIDPFLDISLDLPKHQPKANSNSTQGLHAKKRKAEDQNEDESVEDNEYTLYSCLRRFTQPERLEGGEKFRCSRCDNTYQESTKQLSLKTLPIVICFHLKRFKQGTLKQNSTKIDTYIKYPFHIDMSPYLSATILSNRKGSEQKPEPEMYDLFAVVDHRGKIDNGHFVCYARHGDEWFKCDDAWITKATQQQIAKSKGSYLLFYIKHNLEYAQSEPLDCLTLAE
jgi:ubiquitin carboxyl-terminal hydrolase 22/27/51